MLTWVYPTKESIERGLELSIQRICLAFNWVIGDRYIATQQEPFYKKACVKMYLGLSQFAPHQGDTQ